MNKEERITVVFKEAGKRGEIKTIENELETLQKMVGGYIEAVPFPAGNDILLICNEEGKLMKLKPNFTVAYNLKGKEVCDYIVGDVLFVSVDGEEFGSLTEEQIECLKKEGLI